MNDECKRTIIIVVLVIFVVGMFFGEFCDKRNGICYNPKHKQQTEKIK